MLQLPSLSPLMSQSPFFIFFPSPPSLSPLYLSFPLSLFSISVPLSLLYLFPSLSPISLSPSLYLSISLSARPSDLVVQEAEDSVRLLGQVQGSIVLDERLQLLLHLGCGLHGEQTKKIRSNRRVTYLD